MRTRTRPPSGRVSSVVIQDDAIKGDLTDGSHFRSYNPGDPALIGDLLNNGVEIRALEPEQPGLLMQMLVAWLPFIVLIGVWVWFMRRSGGAGGGGVLGFGKSRARQHATGDRLEEQAFLVGEVTALSEPDNRMHWVVSDDLRAC